MLYPKKKQGKKRKQHKKSILQEKDGTCYLCARQGKHQLQTVQEHHVYDGNANRTISEREGFKVYLCLKHHTDGAEAVHSNHGNMRLVQQDCQREYEKEHTREAFMALIGRNYL